MEIALSSETQRLLEKQLATGRYQSPDAAIRAALETLMELDTPILDGKTLDAIDRAEARLERGEFYDWKDVRERVRAKFLGGGKLAAQSGRYLSPDPHKRCMRATLT